MHTFFSPAKVWPSGQRLPHLYYVPDPDQVAPLRDAYLPIVRDHLDCLAIVEPQWLHATLLKITTSAEAIDTMTRAELATRLAAGLAVLPRLELIAGPALAGNSAIMVDLTPDEGWTWVRDTAAAIVTDVLGPGSVSLGGGRPHLTLAYGTGDGDSGVMGSALRRATGLRVPLTLDRLHLVEVTQHPGPDLYGYHWTSLASLPLGTDREDSILTSPDGHRA